MNRSHGAVCEPSNGVNRRSAEFVRLSQLRRLRECEQVAAVCYRVREGRIEFLLIRTRGGGRWTFPKGSAEPGLTHAQAAALEAFEEAGVHGRIEEAAFTRYVRRRQPVAMQRPKRKNDAQEIVVMAHLCEVSRLSAPQESRRDRTWFTVEEARQRLSEGRGREDGAEFARVINRAVARIESARNCDRVSNDRQQTSRTRFDPRDVKGKDALQEVRFDFAEGYGRVEVALAMRKTVGMRQFALPAVNSEKRDLLRGEVLEFGPPRKGRPKDLGTGMNPRG